MHSVLRILIAGLLISGIPSVGRAALITFTHEGSGSGTLDGISFNNANFRILATGDTTNRQEFGEEFGQGFSISHDSASIEINGVGNFTFTIPTRTFVSNSNSVVGFSLGGGIFGSDLYNGPSNSVFNSWDMFSSIGPISGSTKLLQWTSSDLNTNNGLLVFDDQSTTGVFTANTVAVPESQTILGAATAISFGTAFKRKLSKKQNKDELKA